MKQSGEIFSKQPYPSPNPRIQLSEIIYWSNDLRVKGLLAEPKGKGNYEGILYLRGGIQRVGMVRPSRIAQFAAQGFVVFAPYYRGNRGGEGFDEFAGDDRYDAVHAVDVLKLFLKVHRIHIFSFSRGGIMALWTAILRNDIASVVTWAGVTDAALTYEERKDMRRMMKRVIGGTPTNHPELYHARTPLNYMDEFTSRVLIIHGLQDQHVSLEHARKLEAKLSQSKNEVGTWYFEEYKHHFPPAVNRQTVRDLTQWMRNTKGDLS
jgi:dipeptidyl aminopeptidase/acylaminoacyl peptidase